MKALILSGGTGSRMRPLTYTKPKQLIPVANKPILFYIIEKVINAGITDIGIIVGDTGTEVISEIEAGGGWNANFTYIYQKEPLGLAHAVKTASGFLGDSDFLMLLGDNLFNTDLDGIIETFYSNSSNACILLYKADDPSQFGVAVVDNDVVVKVVEKPKKYVGDLIITGIYAFDKSILQAIDRIKPSKRGELEITDALQNLIDCGGSVSCRLVNGWWKDTGNPKDLLEANSMILDEIETKIETVSDKTVIILGDAHIGKNVVIKDSIIKGPVAIDDDSVIVNSIIGPYASLGENARVANSVINNSILFDNVTIENIPKIQESLIGKNL